MNFFYSRLFTKEGNLHPKLNGLCSRWNQDAFIWIPKNASSNLRHIFGEKKHNIKDFDVKTYWVILRNPFSRWVSGVLEFLSVNPTYREYVFDNIDEIVFDHHTIPQHLYLDFDYQQNTNFLHMSSDNWLGKIAEVTNLDIDLSLKMNPSSHHPDKEDLLKDLNKLITVQFKNKINEFYYEDMLLIDSVKFR